MLDFISGCVFGIFALFTYIEVLESGGANPSALFFALVSLTALFAGFAL